MSEPNFSPFPFEALRRVSRAEARLESAIARWLDAAPHGAALATLVGGVVRVRVIAPVAADPHAAWCEVRDAGIRVAGGSAFVRRLAQRVLGGPAELAAPRPLTVQEQAIWALAVSTALDDLGIRAEVVLASAAAITHALAAEISADRGDGHSIPAPGELVVVGLAVPPGFALRVPPARSPRVRFAGEAPVVGARCALAREAVARLATRDVVAVERCLEIAALGGAIGLVARGVVVEVATEYVPRAMALPDDAHVELTVTAGGVRLSLRELGELAVGSIVPLARPLSGPFELRAAGAVIGAGELVNIEGELGVRVIRIDGGATPP